MGDYFILDVVGNLDGWIKLGWMMKKGNKLLAYSSSLYVGRDHWIIGKGD